jgi:hypothetical protein
MMMYLPVYHNIDIDNPRCVDPFSGKIMVCHPCWPHGDGEWPSLCLPLNGLSKERGMRSLMDLEVI